MARLTFAAGLSFALRAAGVEVDAREYGVVAGRAFSFTVLEGAPEAMGRNNRGQLGIGNTDDTNQRVFVPLPQLTETLPLPESVRAIQYAKGVNETRDCPAGPYARIITESACREANRASHFGTVIMVLQDVPESAGFPSYCSILTHSTGRETVVFNYNTVDPIMANVQPLCGWNGIRALAAGAFHSLFCFWSGEVYATGWNKYGQITGSSAMATSLTKVEFPANENATKCKDVAAGYAHSLFLFEDGQVHATGWNFYGQLGHGADVNMVSTPVNVTTGATAIAAGYDFSYVVAGDNLYVAGNNLGNQLGSDTLPEKVSKLSMTSADVVEIAAGQTHGLYRTKGGSLYSMGSNFDGQLGLGNDQVQPRGSHQINGAESWSLQSIAAGGDSSCLVRNAVGSLRCFGSNREGQLGLDTTTTAFSPSAVDGVDGYVEDLGLGDTHSLFLAHPDKVYVTGANQRGQLGLNDTNFTLTVRRLDTNFEMPTTPKRTDAPTPAPTPAPPTPAAPSPVTTLAPSPTRAPGSDGESQQGFPWWVAVVVMVAGVGIIFIAICANPGDANAESAVEAPGGRGSTPETDLELMRAQMTNE